jgi:FkbM family methyltransferase
MKYDFIEIGTSNFDTLIEAADDNTVGLSIEPISYYLDQLPNRAGVKKLAVAISRNHGMLPVFYIPERTIRARGLPEWLRGCNSVGDYHPKHVELMVRDLVQIDTVDVMTIADIFDLHDVTELDYLKIDTEGADCEIMYQLNLFLEKQPKSRYPKKILFESNELAVPAEVELVKNTFVKLGYNITQAGYDTVLEYKKATE